MSSKPKISVILPVFNGEKYLNECLDSIFGQTFKDFELIIINDGSKDKSEEIIKQYKDKRVIYIDNKENIGVTRSLNKGLKIAKGEYIARIDCDDVNELSRFEKQVKFLEKNPEYVMVGSNFEIINENSEIIGKSKLPENHNEIKRQLFIRNVISHPSVMYRSDVVKKLGGYRNIFNGAEDYDLWFRLIRKGKFYNFTDFLIKRRWHKDVVTSRKHIEIELKAILVRLLNII